MKKLILTLLILCLTSPVFATSINVCNGGTATTLTSVNLCTSGTSSQVNPKIWTGSAWYAMISYLSEWRLIAGIGQSNLVGAPCITYNFGTIPTVTDAGIEIHTDGTYTNPIAEPTGQDDSPFQISGGGEDWPTLEAGSIWLALANKYYELTGQKVIVLSLGIAATTIAQWNSTYSALAKTEIDLAISTLTTDGYDFDFEEIIWLQGFSDSGTSVATYETRLNTLCDYFTNQYSLYDISIAIAYGYGSSTNPHDADDLVAASRSDVYVASNLVRTNASGFHFNQDDLNEIGEAIAASIATVEGF